MAVGVGTCMRATVPHQNARVFERPSELFSTDGQVRSGDGFAAVCAPGEPLSTNEQGVLVHTGLLERAFPSDQAGPASRMTA